MTPGGLLVTLWVLEMGCYLHVPFREAVRGCMMQGRGEGRRDTEDVGAETSTDEGPVALWIGFRG